MSGPIRQMIGPVKKRLATYIGEVNDHLKKKPEPENKEEVAKWIQSLRNDLLRIQNSIKVLDEQNMRWSQFLDGQPSEEKMKAELAIYDTAAGGDNGFIILMENGREAADTLSSTIMEAERVVSQNVLNPFGTSSQINMGAQAVLTGGNSPDKPFVKQKLPEQTTPEFENDAKEWPAFWDSFTSAIDQTPLAEVQKFNYLRGCLKGISYKLISRLPVISANYKVAVEILKERYGNLDRIKNELNDELRDLKPASPNTQSVRQLVDDFEGICMQLEGMKVDVNHPQIQSSIESKLPRWVMMELAKAEIEVTRPDKDGNKQIWDCKAIRIKLKEILAYSETVNRKNNSQRSNVNSNAEQRPSRNFIRRDERTKEVKSEARVFAIKTSVQPNKDAQINQRPAPQRGQRQNEGARFPPKCLFCQCDHYSKDCIKFSSAEARQKRLITLKRCILCCFEGHSVAECPKKYNWDWKCKKCRGLHKWIVCPRTCNVEMKAMTPKPTISAMVVGDVFEGQPNKRDQAFLMTREVLAFKKQNRGCGKNWQAEAIESNLFIDPGATRSLVEEELSDELKLESEGEEVLDLYGIGAKPPETIRSQKVKIAIGNPKKGKAYQFALNTKPEIISEKFAMIEFAEEDLPVLRERIKELPISVKKGKVNILIGMDYCWDVITKLEKLPSGLFLLETLFGPIVCGPNPHLERKFIQEFDFSLNEDRIWNEEEALEPISCDEEEPEGKEEVIVLSSGEEEEQDERPQSIHQYSIILKSVDEEKEDETNEETPVLLTKKEIEKFWSFEDISIKEDPAQDDNEVAMDMLQKSITHDGTRYSVGWPFRSPNPDLPTNLNICIHRLKANWKKLSANPEMMKKYDDVMRQQLDMGIIEEVPEGHADSALIHYLPHHHVLPKFRVVFGANARMKGRLSLNDCLYTGPNLLPDLVGLLLRFRVAKIVLTADVEKAFLRIGLHLADREMTRFLWLRDCNKPPTPSNLKTMRFTSVTFGIGASPFILMATIKHHLKKEGSQLAKEISNNTYMDNLLMAASTIEEALRKHAESKKIFERADMNLREYMSSEKVVNEAIPKEDLLVKEKTKFLGIYWQNDMLIFQFPKQIEVPITKRTILQTMNRFFDPLGLFTPVMLTAKILFQSTWLEDSEWDTTLPEEKEQIWKEILHSWDVPAIEMPRLILPKEQSQLRHQLHVFTDASEKAYAAAVYLQTTDGQEITSRLVLSKSRLAKKNETTIPRLELVAILIGLRAVKFAMKQLQLGNSLNQEIQLWSDSQIALHWIASKENQPVFVANRLKEIRTHKDVKFNYVPTMDNPADFATRGMSAEEIRHKRRWWEGPQFLIQPESEWPFILRVRPPEDDGEEENEEQNKSTVEVKVAMLTSTTVENEVKGPSIFDATRYNSYEKRVKSTAIFLKFLKFNVVKGKREDLLISKMSMEKRITAKDLKISELYLIRNSQSQYPASEEEKKRWNLWQLNGVWRCGTRLQKSELAADAIDPMYLPKKAQLTAMIITQTHEQNFHAGVQMTWSEIRRKFWLPNGRRTINKVIRKCISCRKRKGPAYTMPPFPPYPKVRVVPSPAFTHVGLDYLGPTKVSINGTQQSYWILLVTCLATRGVHLEGIADLSTTTFLNALRRFTALRRRPATILSDNATHFIAASKALDKIWQNAITNEEATSYYAKKKIEWKTTIQHAPWEGAIYERLVGSVKTAFKSAIGRRILPLDEMQTLIAEVSSTLNSRPITPMDDELDAIVALRPIDFIQPLAEAGFPPLNEELEEEEWLPKATTSEKLLKKWKEGTRALDKFWVLWQQLYLDTLKDRQQRKHNHPHHQSKIAPKVGEIVLVTEETQPRGFWKMGKIIELPNEDPTKVRSANVLMPNGHVLRRSLKHLVPLEISEEQPDVEQPLEKASDAPAPKQKELENRRVTRSMKTKQTVAAAIIEAPTLKKAPFFMFALITLISLFCQTMVLARECPSNYTLSDPIRIHSEVCKRNGTSIWELDTHEVCSTEINCPVYQHLSPAKNEQHPLSGIDDELPQFYLMVNYCGPKCFCPKWADGCSFYEGPSAHTSDAKNEATKKALEEFEEDVCSFQQAENCSKTPVKKHIHEIQLYDGTRHFVNKLDLEKVELIEDEFECVGSGPPITGSKKYCEKHQCKDIGNQFCYYPKAEATRLHLGNVSFPIKAWSTYEAEIYHHLTKEERIPIKVCGFCKLECVEGGVKVITNEEVGIMEICSHHVCVNRENPSPTEFIQLPDEVLLANHKAKLKLWSRTKEEITVPNNTIECQKLPICQLIKCMLCKDHLKNPECVPVWFILLTAIVLYTTVSKMVACLQLMGICGKIAKLSCWTFWALMRTCCRGGCSCCKKLHGMIRRGRQKQLQDKPEEVVTSPKAKKFEPIYFTMIVGLALIMLPTARTCSEVAVIDAKHSTCKTIEEGITQCTVTENVLLSLVPSGQQSCLLIKTEDGTPLGTFTIEATTVELTCQPVRLYDTRSYEMKVAVSKRCPRMGSCSGEFCANVKMDTRIEELGSANDARGHSYCIESCSWCDNCLLPTAACLFFRVYAAPIMEDTATYTVFKCPSWQYRVKTRIVQTNAQGIKSMEKNATLAVGQVTRIGAFQLSITPSGKMPMPILGEMFITNGRQTAIILDGTRTNLFMRCGNQQNATNFQCEVMANQCQCGPAISTLNCECNQMNIDAEVMTNERVLPVDSFGYVLKGQGQRVYCEVQFSPMMIQIAVEGLQLTPVYSETLCRITSASLEGCASCLHGAKFKARCETDGEETLAHVSCDEVSFHLPCGGSGEVTRQIQFQDILIEKNCSVSCPKGTTFFSLVGQLTSLETPYHQIFTNVKVSNQFIPNSPLSFSLIFGIVKEWKLFFALCFIVIYIAPKLIKLSLKIIVRLIL